MSKMWFVQAPGENGDLWVTVDDDSLNGLTGKTSAKSQWKAERRIATGELVPDVALEFAVSNHGKRAGDILWTEGSPLYVVSDRFVDALRSIDATGWQTYPVYIERDSGEEVSGYQGLAITGSCGDYYKTLPTDQTPGSLGVPVHRGVDASVGWDGSDVFGLRGKPLTHFNVTDRAHKALVEAGVERVIFTNEDDFEDPAD